MSQADPTRAPALLPLSPVQEWHLKRSGEDAVLPMRWEVRGAVPAHVIEDALVAAISRHAPLRTAIAERGSVAGQEVVANASFKLGQVDLRTLPIDDHDSRIDGILSDMATLGFDLVSAPLLKATLVRTSSHRASLLLVAHRAVFDDRSASLLCNELNAHISSVTSGIPDPRAPLELEYADYALWQRDCRKSDRHSADLAFWRQRLGERAAYRLRGDQDLESRHIAQFRVPLPPRFGARLSEGAKRHGTEPEVLALTATGAGIARMTGDGDLALLTCMDRRDTASLAPLIGAFDDIRPLALTVRPDALLSNLVKGTAAAMVDARSHDGPPIQDVLDAIGVPSWAGLSGVSNVGFDFRADTKDNGGADARPMISATQTRRSAFGKSLDLTVTLTGESSGWQLLLHYRGGRFSRRFVAELSRVLLGALNALIDGDDLHLSDLPRPDVSSVSAEQRPSPPLNVLGPMPTWQIAPLRNGTQDGPVIVAMGRPTLYRRFAECFWGDRSVISLSVPDQTALARQQEIGFEAALGEAADMLLERYAGRPLVLVGRAADGVSSLQLARALGAEGSDPQLVAMIDAWAPTEQYETGFGRIRASLAFAKRWQTDLANALRGRIGAQDLALKSALGRRILRLFDGTVDAAQGADFHAAIDRFHASATKTGRFRGWTGEVMAFASESQPWSAYETLFGWLDLIAPDTPIYDIRGSYEDTLLWESYGRIAEVIDTRLTRKLGTPRP